MAHRLGSEELESADIYARKNFDSFSKTDEFLNVSYSCLKELISKTDLNVTSEEVVFEAVLKWVKASPSERQDKLRDLLSEVRMTYLPYDYLTERAASEELLSSSNAAKDLIEKVKKYHSTPPDGLGSAGFKTLPRDYIATHVLCAVCHNKSSGLSVYSYSFFSEEWSSLSSFQCGESVLQVTATRDKLFIFLDAKLMTFHLENLEWKLLEAEHEKIGGAAVVLHENIIYCFGSSHDRASDRIRRFDSQKCEWLSERKMKSGRCYPAAVSLGKYIVVTGGYNGSLNLNSAEKYDPSTDEWSEIASMLTPRFGHGCVNAKDKLYVCGGFDKISQLHSAEVYDPLLNQWKFISSMKTARQFFSLVSHNSKIYAVGGLTEGYEVTLDAEIYDLESNQWKSSRHAPEGFEFAVSVPPTCNQNVHHFGNLSEKSSNIH